MANDGKPPRFDRLPVASRDVEVGKVSSAVIELGPDQLVTVRDSLRAAIGNANDGDVFDIRCMARLSLNEKQARSLLDRLDALRLE